MAYSLLGIFGVSMPLLYGEGKKAFFLLQEEILKESDDQSIFAWNYNGVHGYGENWIGGPLADSPSRFEQSGNIIPIPSSPERLPYAMTNKGLRIELPLTPLGGSYGVSIAVLDCQYENDFSGLLGIVLIGSSPSLYRRMPSRNLEFVGPHDWRLPS